MDQAAVPFFRQFLSKYKYVALVLLIGIVLMLLPVERETTQQAPQSQPEETKQEPMELQEQLSRLLSQMEGAGQVRVLLTQATGEKTLGAHLVAGDAAETQRTHCNDHILYRLSRIHA